MSINHFNLKEKIEFVKKFLTQTIYNLENIQKYSTFMRRFYVDNITSFTGSFTYKSEPITLEANEKAVKVNHTLIFNSSLTLKLLKLNKLFITIDEYESIFKSRPLIFINGLKIKDSQVKLIIDTRYTWVVISDNAFVYNNICIINIPVKQVLISTSNTIAKSNIMGVIAFENGLMKDYDIDLGNVIFDTSGVEREIYFINNIGEFITHNNEANNAYFQLEMYADINNVLLFKDNKLVNNDVTTYHNTIFKINSFNSNSLYHIISLDYTSGADRNLFLDLYVIENPDMIQFYVNNVEMIDMIKNIDIENYFEDFSVLSKGNTDTNAFVDSFIDRIITNHPYFFETYIQDKMYPMITDKVIRVNFSWLGKNLRTNTKQDIFGLDIQFPTEKYVLNLKDSNCRVLVNSTPVEMKDLYQDDVYGYFLYIDSSLISVGDLIIILDNNTYYIDNGLTTNVLSNSDGKPIDNTFDYNSYAWDKTLHADAKLPLGGWTAGYNAGVTSPSIGYHAKWALEGIDGPSDLCMKFVDKNDIYGLGHRWMGISKYLGLLGTLGWEVGTELEVSWYQKTDTVGKGARVGIGHTKVGTGGYEFGDFIATISATKINEWERVSYKKAITSDWDTTKPCHIYVYGDGGPHGILWVDNLMITKTSYLTPYSNSSVISNINNKTYNQLYTRSPVTIDFTKDYTEYDKSNINISIYYKEGSVYNIIDKFKFYWLSDRKLVVEGLSKEYINKTLYFYIATSSIIDFNINATVTNATYEIMINDLNLYLNQNMSVFLDDNLINASTYDLIHIEENNNYVVSKLRLNNITLTGNHHIRIRMNDKIQVIFTKNAYNLEFIALDRFYDPNIHFIYINGELYRDMVEVDENDRRVIRIVNGNGDLVIKEFIHSRDDGLLNNFYNKYITLSKDKFVYKTVYAINLEMTEYKRKYLAMIFLLDSLNEGAFETDNTSLYVHDVDGVFNAIAKEGMATIDLNNSFAGNGGTQMLDLWNSNIPIGRIENKSHYKRLIRNRLI